jgi:hypothetical protein
MARIGLTLDRKFRRLARLLDDTHVGFGEIIARGALELLWDAAYEAADDYIGDLVDVEAAAHWRGKEGVLLAALVNAGGEGLAGFIDEGGSPFWPEGKPGTYRVHDLWDHAPDFVARRATRETEREAKGESLSALRSAAGKKGRAKQLSGNCPANGGQADDGSPSVADPDMANCGQVAGKSTHSPAPPLPAPGRPVPSRPVEGSGGEASPAPSRPDQPREANDVGRLVGEEWLLSFRQDLGRELGFDGPMKIGNDSKVVTTFERHLSAVGHKTLLHDCVALAGKSNQGTPASLSWFVAWLPNLPMPKGWADAN